LVANAHAIIVDACSRVISPHSQGRWIFSCIGRVGQIAGYSVVIEITTSTVRFGYGSKAVPRVAGH